MQEVFISYHEESSGRLARQIVEALERENISCFFAPRDTKSGPWIESLLKALNECRIFLVILDEQSNCPRGYVFNEMMEAFILNAEKGFPLLVPFKVGNFSLSPVWRFLLRPFHILEGGEGDSLENTNISELITKISADLDGKPLKRS